MVLCTHDVTYPNAKINLGLRVLEKRSDGFHNIETVFYPIPHCDILEVLEAKENKMYLYGIEYDGNADDNLCMRAYRLLAQDYKLPPVEIHLYKKIPVGAGLGGGSADAAFTLKSLNKIFQLQLTQEQLVVYAAKLGSDCPFFILNTPMLGTQKGEILSPISIPALENYRIELVSPPIFVSTPDAYSGIVPRDKREANGEELIKTPLTELLQLPVTEWKNVIENDFELTVFKKFPQLKGYKEELYSRGAIYASMSGSGSSMFGVFEK